MKRIIGPFLGPREISGISINIGLPDHTIEDLTCKLFLPNQSQPIQEITVKPIYNCFKLFQFEFKDLDTEKTYTYKFLYKDKNGQLIKLDLENELTYDDCKFKVLGNDERSSFIVLSCNNPFETEKGSADSGWAMWEQLENHLKKDDSIRLIVLGGDQVYNDDIEKDFLSTNNKPKSRKKQNLSDEKLKKELSDKFISQYQKYWGHKSYRRVFASTPSVTMWDDHDITDGWGSRPESFPKLSITKTKSYYFKDNWWEYFKVAREAFTAYQASRNNNRISNVPEKVFSSYLDWGDSRFILCDFRSERNSKRKILWSDEHKNAVLSFIKKSPEQIKRIFFLTPVVALRTNLKEDKRLGKVAKALFDFKSHIKKNPKYILKDKLWFLLPIILFLFPLLFPLAILLFECNVCDSFVGGLQVFMYIILAICFYFLGLLSILWIVISKLIIKQTPHLPELSDDIEDGLSSEANIKSLKEILDALTKVIKENNKEVFILSGDIHLGGLTEIIDSRDNNKSSILQIVSSPIAYKPMPKVVEGLTTTTSEMVLRECSNEKRLFARNIFYISKRNFVQIIPSKIDEGKGIRFFLEGHQFPIIFPKKFI